MTARATDNGGASTVSAPVSGVRVDNTAPVVALDSPAANVRDTVTLTSTSSDTGLAQMAIAELLVERDRRKSEGAKPTVPDDESVDPLFTTYQRLLQQRDQDIHRIYEQQRAIMPFQ